MIYNDLYYKMVFINFDWTLLKFNILKKINIKNFKSQILE